jgi:hypothetical protein
MGVTGNHRSSAGSCRRSTTHPGRTLPSHAQKSGTEPSYIHRAISSLITHARIGPCMVKGREVAATRSPSKDKEHTRARHVGVSSSAGILFRPYVQAPCMSSRTAAVGQCPVPAPSLVHAHALYKYAPPCSQFLSGFRNHFRSPSGSYS